MRNSSVPTCTGCALCRERETQPNLWPAEAKLLQFRHCCPMQPPCQFVLETDHIVVFFSLFFSFFLSNDTEYLLFFFISFFIDFRDAIRYICLPVWVESNLDYIFLVFFCSLLLTYVIGTLMRFLIRGHVHRKIYCVYWISFFWRWKMNI